MGATKLKSGVVASRYDRAPHIFLAAFAGVWVVTAIRPLYFQDWFLENLLVFATVPVLVGTYRRFRFSNLSYLLITLFLILHVIGAHYTYSEVPLGNWLRDGWQMSRNHYDRVVHFTFGLFLAYPLWEILVRVGGVRNGWSYAVTVPVVLAGSGFFEVVEAIVAGLVSPELGAAYNGIQGDIWDAQKDMSLALTGAVICMMVTATFKRNALPSSGNSPTQSTKALESVHEELQ